MEATWVKKGDEERFVHGIDGSFLLCPFQCDLCWFRNLQKRSPREGSYADARVLSYIRRVNLDICWSRSEGTISSVKNDLIKLVNCWKDLGLKIDLPPLGPWPIKDVVGFRLAIGHLRYSQRPGKNRATHLQYDTVRKLWTMFNHLNDNSPSDQLLTSFRTLGGDIYRPSSCPTQSRAFSMFMRGLLLRMGRQTETNWGLDYRVLLVMLFNMEEDMKKGEKEHRHYAMMGCFFVVAFVLALRGNEVFMVEAGALIDHFKFGVMDLENEDGHVVVPLLGRFKNEDGEVFHLMLSVNTTASGLEVRKWVGYVVDILKQEGRLSGPAFCRESGYVLTSTEVNEEFWNQLERFREERPELIPSNTDVRHHYNIYRLPRRGSTARATDQGVDEPTINLHNRWRSREQLQGQRSRRSMRDYYTDLRLTINKLLLYTKAL